MSFLRPTLFCAAIATLAVAGADAHADTVAKRAIRMHEAPGHVVGGFKVKTTLNVATGTNDNIYATTTNEKSGTLYRVNPELEISKRSDKFRSKLTAGTSVENYFDKANQYVHNPYVSIDAGYRITPATSLTGGAGFAVRHDERGDPNSLSNSVKPLEYHSARAELGLAHRMGDWRFKLGSKAETLDFINGYSSTGAVVDNDARDRLELTHTGQIGYRYDNQLTPFIRTTVTQRDYTRKAPTNRTNVGTQVDVGTAFRLLPAVMGEAYVGSLHRNYTTSSFSDTNALDFGGNVAWNIGSDTTLTGAVRRSIEETTIAASSGFVQTASDVGVEHALSPDWIVTGGLGHRYNKYRGTTFPQRKDIAYIAKVGTTYYVDQNLSVGADYGYRKRDSNVNGSDYGRNTVMLRASYSY